MRVGGVLISPQNFPSPNFWRSRCSPLGFVAALPKTNVFPTPAVWETWRGLRDLLRFDSWAKGLLLARLVQTLILGDSRSGVSRTIPCPDFHRWETPGGLIGLRRFVSRAEDSGVSGGKVASYRRTSPYPILRSHAFRFGRVVA